MVSYKFIINLLCDLMTMIYLSHTKTDDIFQSTAIERRIYQPDKIIINGKR